MTVAREKLDELYQAAVDMAGFLLEQAGEFFPIGCVVTSSGEVTHVAIHDGDEHPDVQQVMDGLQQLFRKQAADGEIVASALAIGIRARRAAEDPPTDAICVRLRSADFCRDAIVPYTLKSSGFFRKTRTVEMGEAWAQAAEQDIFL